VLMFATVFGFLPQAIVSVFGGVWADRHNRKLIIIAADGTIALTTLVLAGLLLRGMDDLWLIYVALAIRSVGAGVQQPAVGALLPQIVPTEKLMRVNGISTSIQSGSALLAPALAAWLYASFALGSVLLVDVVTAVIGIGLLTLIPVPRLLRTGEPVGYLDDLRGGLRYVRGHPVVRRVLLFFALIFFLVVPPSYLTPLMVVRSFGAEVWKLTALEIAFSVGMILGGAVLAWWGGVTDRIAMLAGASIAFGLLTVGLGLSSTLWVFLAFMFLCGICLPFFWTTSQTLLQETVEPEMQGRVFGLLGIVMSLAMPVGMLVFGPLSDVVSVETLLVVAGLLTALVGVVVVTRFSTVVDDARQDPVA
jgi:DHA3 family macrolide efflux protein-like MFS transporter